MTPIAIPEEVAAAVETCRAAISERAALDALAEKVADEGKRAAAAKVKVAKRLDAVEADIELSLARDEANALTGAKSTEAAPLKAARKEAEALRREIADLDAGIQRSERIARALPEKLAAADGVIEPAVVALRVALAPFAAAMAAAYEATVIEAAEKLTKTLAPWLIVAQALRSGQIQMHLRDMKIPAVRHGTASILDDGFVLRDGQRVPLSAIAGAELAEQFEPLRKILPTIDTVMRRIADDRERARLISNELARAAMPIIHNSTLPATQPSAQPSPAPRFAPTARDAHRSPGRMIEANVVLAGHANGSSEPMPAEQL